MATAPFFSIIIPVYNGGAAFVRCLTEITQSMSSDWELIVVDDGSEDGSTIIAAHFGAKVIQTSGRLGPGAARNIGAQIAGGSYLCFIDADCEVNHHTLPDMAQTLQCHSDIDALFGSYDDTPKATNFVAQYKNLLHHYVHQHGSEDASTFWAGCGAVRRSTFLAIGGFDVQRFQRPSIEDIDLGYRIKQAGGKICLAKTIQVKHHKAWRLLNLIKTDLFDRGIPWTRLLLSNKALRVNDLNLQMRNRLSVLISHATPLALVASLFWMNWLGELVLVPALVIFFLVLNLDVYRFFYAKRGLLFTIGTIPMHWLYHFYSGLALILGILLHWHGRKQPVIAPTPTISVVE